jgi:hypothetical protein
MINEMEQCKSLSYAFEVFSPRKDDFREFSGRQIYSGMAISRTSDAS